MLKVSRLLVPTRTQWRQWSMPSKLTFLGAGAGLISIVLSVALSRWPLSGLADRNPPPDAIPGESPKAFPLESARLAIGAMIHDFPALSPLRVRSITSPVDDMTAVAIEPPYREFSNVVLFHFDDGTKRWKRVFEGLTIGIDSNVSHVLDVHTVGEAIDIARPTSSDERAFLADHGYGLGWVPVSYDKFIHLHCTLFDVPDIYRVSLSHDSGHFELVARTVNDQEWTVSFTGIDGESHLAHKVIDARLIKK